MANAANYMRPVIQVSGVRKTYGRTVAVDEVSLEVSEGEIFGLIGPNGAGKTALINVLTGFQRAGAGTVELEGETVDGIAPHRLRRKGVARTFQSGRLSRELAARRARAKLLAKVRSSLESSP